MPSLFDLDPSVASKRKSKVNYLSRREQEVLDIIYGQGRATTSSILEALPDELSRPAIRSILRSLEEKEQIRHEEEGKRFIYIPKLSRPAARRAALKHLVNTFFDGSASSAMVTLLDLGGEDVTDEQEARLQELLQRIKKARRS